MDYREDVLLYKRDEPIPEQICHLLSSIGFTLSGYTPGELVFKRFSRFSSPVPAELFTLGFSAKTADV